MRNELRTISGKLYAIIEDYGNDRLVLKTPSGRIKGFYHKVHNHTTTESGKVIGTGNILAMIAMEEVK